MPSGTRLVTLVPPFRGKVNKTAHTYQPGATVHDSRDFWPVDAKTGRARLAIRPGFAAFGSSLTSANLIATVNVAADATNQTTYSRQLMIARAGTLYRHTTGSSFSSVGASAVDESRNVQATSYLRKLYIANETLAYKVYNYSDHSVATWTASAGTIPTDCRLITTWNARIVLAGDIKHPHVVNFSRVDAPDDWDFALEDIGAPIAVPDINEPITCLIPHNRECLICGTFNSMWIFTGDPTNGGVLEKFAYVVGPINGTAWCKDAAETTWMLTRDGLYSMPPGCGAPPQSVSRESIPESLLGLDGINDKAYLEYDVRFRCIHIYVQGSNPQYFHYFPETGGFWPVTSPGAGILAIGRYDPLETSDLSGVIVGTTANIVRLDRTAALGGSDLAYAHIGPFQLAPLGTKAMIRNATGVFGTNTNDTNATVDLYGAETAEDVVALPVGRKNSTTYGKISGNHNNWHPRIGGQSGLLAITQVSTANHISFEQATFRVAQTGMERGG